MKLRAKASGTAAESHFPSHLGVTGTSIRATPDDRRKIMERNFILQMGFEDPAPAIRPLQYSALVFQPRVVLFWILTGILFRSSAVFALLGAFLWWSAMLPKLNPFTALYNLTLGKRPGAFHLGPAPTPRRAAETEAGTTAMTIALLIHAQLMPAAYMVEAIFLSASLAVEFGSFCLGAFIYHVVRGNGTFARQTLPWVENEMPFKVRGSETGAGNPYATKGEPRHGKISN